MQVKFFPAKRANSNLIAGFLSKYRISFELIQPDHIGKPKAWYKSGEVPAVEVDGRLFINPNRDALKKILHVSESGC